MAIIGQEKTSRNAVMYINMFSPNKVFVEYFFNVVIIQPDSV